MEKPRLSFWQIWNMSFGFMGIQFGWGLQMANMSPIYKYLGASDNQIPLLWLAAPLTGFIVQPLIGAMSDRTWGPLGRRRPYFLVGALLSSFALVLMPNCSALWMAAGLLWVLDASINVSMEPFRAYVADKLPEEQRGTGFAMQSFFIGVGAVIAGLLPYILKNWFNVSSDTSSANAIPANVKIAFYAGAAAFLGAVLWTIFTTNEYPPEDLEAFRRQQTQRGGLAHLMREIPEAFLQMPKAMKQLAFVQFFTWLGLFCMWLHFSNAVPERQGFPAFQGWRGMGGRLLRREGCSDIRGGFWVDGLVAKNGATAASRSVSGPRRPGLAERRSDSWGGTKGLAVTGPGSGRRGVGFDPLHALRDPCRSAPATTHRSVYGHLQLLYRAAGNPRCPHFRATREESAGWQPCSRGDGRWRIHAPGRVAGSTRG